MNNLRLPAQDSATGRALKTALQAFVGFLVGLFVVVWKVPGVPTAVLDYLQSNAIQFALLFGIPSGLVALVWNYFRKSVPNY